MDMGQMVKELMGAMRRMNAGMERLEGTNKQVDTLNKNDMRILPPSFHIANIQNLLTKTKSGEKGMFVKQLDKINFLRDQCKDENPYFLALAETWIKDGILESEYTIYGYEHVASHRKSRDGGGSLFYLRED